MISVLYMLIHNNVSGETHMKKVLLIAGLQEQYYYAPFLEACRNIDIHICDPSRYPLESSLMIRQDGITGKIDGFIDTVKLDKGAITESSIQISEISTAWYLRENFIRSQKKNTPVNIRFSHNESRQALRALFSILECNWINRQEDIDKVNSNKLYQQTIAQKCGLSVPSTMVSNSFKDILSFSQEHDGLLLKVMGYIKLDEKGEEFLYSEVFSHDEICKSRESIEVCPLYAQQYVEKLYEYRIMVIGNRILACRIDSQSSEKTRIDWRHYDFDRVSHEMVDLPPETYGKLLSFMKSVNLKYGAIDMIYVSYYKR